MCVCGVGGAVGRVIWKRKGWGGGGGIDNGGSVVGPMCCDVFHLGCPKYTAKPMGRIVAK